MIILQLVIYCLIFTLMVRFSVRGGAIDGMYFYPKAVQDRAIEIGLTTRETMNRKRKIFMTEFYIVMLTTLVLIIGLWNNVSDFKAAYLHALLFLEVMNWYDGIVIDEVWVRYSKFWVIPGCEDIPYVQTIKQMLKKRLFLTLVWVIGAAIVAGIVTLVF
ncbi:MULTISPECIES: hypothetical protein [unclassified Butyrivibrio]|uniref:hypothetical protein n=1 Tax=unclassified Butyrivibrio TaxID=2639466 RepID=UPI0003B5348C|nr:MULTISPECIES: hypothetical protein [unclassified Butyrivibrio]